MFTLLVLLVFDCVKNLWYASFYKRRKSVSEGLESIPGTPCVPVLCHSDWVSLLTDVTCPVKSTPSPWAVMSAFLFGWQRLAAAWIWVW